MWAGRERIGFKLNRSILSGPNLHEKRKCPSPVAVYNRGNRVSSPHLQPRHLQLYGLDLLNVRELTKLNVIRVARASTHIVTNTLILEKQQLHFQHRP